MQIFEDIRYIGETLDGKRHGFGIFECSTYRAIGYHKENQLHGSVMVFLSSGEQYLGRIENDRYREGIYTDSYGNTREGIFSDAMCIYGIITENGCWRMGHFGSSLSQNTGDGVKDTVKGCFQIVLVNNGTYGIGWYGDQGYYGRHRIVFEDGASYHGTFTNHLRHGFGRSLDPEGNVVYQGMWKNDRPVEGQCDRWDGLFLTLRRK